MGSQSIETGRIWIRATGGRCNLIRRRVVSDTLVG